MDIYILILDYDGCGHEEVYGPSYLNPFAVPYSLTFSDNNWTNTNINFGAIPEELLFFTKCEYNFAYSEDVKRIKQYSGDRWSNWFISLSSPIIHNNGTVTILITSSQPKFASGVQYNLNKSSLGEWTIIKRSNWFIT